MVDIFRTAGIESYNLIPAMRNAPSIIDPLG